MQQPETDDWNYLVVAVKPSTTTCKLLMTAPTQGISYSDVDVEFCTETAAGSTPPV